MQETGQELTLDEMFAKVEAIAENLEKSQLALEEAFAAYEQGVRLLCDCNQRIDEVEKKMLVMNADGTLEPFAELGGESDE